MHSCKRGTTMMATNHDGHISVHDGRINDGHNVDFDGQSKTFTYTYDLRRGVTKNGPQPKRRMD